MITVERIPNLLIILMCFIALVFTIARIVKHRRIYSPIFWTVNVYTAFSLTYYGVLHLVRTFADQVPNNDWFLFVATLLVSTICINAIIGDGLQ